MLACMPAYLGGVGALGAKIVSSSSRAVAPGEPRPMSALVVLADLEGRFLSVMCGTQLGALRTAAASAVAIRHLARDDASVMAIIGCGVQGGAELAGALATRQLSRVHVFDTDAPKAQAFARAMTERHGLPVVAEPSAEAAIRQAGIVAMATSSMVPVAAVAAIQPGTHINAVGAHTPGTRELDSDTVARARLFVESRQAVLAEAGDVLIPMRRPKSQRRTSWGNSAMSSRAGCPAAAPGMMSPSSNQPASPRRTSSPPRWSTRQPGPAVSASRSECNPTAIALSAAGRRKSFRFFFQKEALSYLNLLRFTWCRAPEIPSPPARAAKPA